MNCVCGYPLDDGERWCSDRCADDLIELQAHKLSARLTGLLERLPVDDPDRIAPVEGAVSQPDPRRASRRRPMGLANRGGTSGPHSRRRGRPG